ncbi:MAG: hypothetical protein KME55_38180 [Nostoc indistinguendum CM1-VF10]|jgi:hypothetical protein|nr:hypothetical protein [Nostoc indistinguendum CM1-VF10]
MPKRIRIATHLNISELEQLYRQAKNVLESRQCQVLWLLTQGKNCYILRKSQAIAEHGYTHW